MLLHIKKAFQEELITDSGLKLFLDPSYQKEQFVSVVATIVALPSKVHPKDEKILSQLKVGDEIAVSYQIVYDLSFKSDKLNFMPVSEGSEMMQSYVNGKGEWVKIVALPGNISPIWVGYYQDKFRNLISGVQGTHSDMERWKSQFSFGKTDVFSFNNFFEFEGKDYWVCNLDDIFAKKVKGHLVAVGNRIICKPIEGSVPQELLSQIRYTHSVKIRFQDRGRVISGGKEKHIKKDDVIAFEPQYCEKYEFWGKNYFLINENFVLGKWN